MLEGVAYAPPTVSYTYKPPRVTMSTGKNRLRHFDVFSSGRLAFVLEVAVAENIIDG